MSTPDLRRFGDAFEYVWREEAVAIGLDRFQETRDGLHAEITVQSMAPGFDGHIHGPARLNLLSTESQNRLAKVLAERVNHVDWQGMLTLACNLTTSRWRQPPPYVDLAEAPEPGPVEVLLPGIPKSETTCIYGDGEGGKSLLVLLIALATLSGVVLPWACSVETPLTVMYLDWETNERTVNSRFRRMCRGYGLADIPHLLYREMHRPLVDVVDVLRADRDRLGIDVFIFDSISYACSGSLNDDDVARGVMNAMRQLAPATRIGTAHVNQETARATATTTARPFGSAFFWNGMRSGWEIHREPESPPDTIDLGVYHRKTNDVERERPFAVHVNFDGRTGPIRFSRGDLAASPDLIGRTTMSTRLRAALRGGKLTTNELVEQLETTKDTVLKTAKRMPDVIELEQGGGRGNPSVWGLSQ